MTRKEVEEAREDFILEHKYEPSILIINPIDFSKLITSIILSEDTEIFEQFTNIVISELKVYRTDDIEEGEILVV